MAEEAWKKNLDEAVLVTAGIVMRHADMLKEHDERLREHTRAMLEFDKNMDELRATQAETAQELKLLMLSMNHLLQIGYLIFLAPAGCWRPCRCV